MELQIEELICNESWAAYSQGNSNPREQLSRSVEKNLKRVARPLEGELTPNDIQYSPIVENVIWNNYI